MNSRDDQKRNVQQSTDIVRLIGEHVSLRPRGKEFIGVCPFHDDKNPSMYVSPVKQIYKCFSCGAGGDVFTFAMEYHKMTFPEAMKYLADRAGIKLEVFHKQGGDGDENASSNNRQLIADANAKALAFFQTIYRHKEHGAIAREYVEGRHISAEMIEQFQLGYAPDRWDGLFLMVQDKNWNLKGFELAGLVSPRQNGQGHFDRLRHRIIFPICDALGRPIAFGGRKIRAEDEPKYLNSPETALFNKSATLYGLHLAKKAIIDSRTAVIVEGYTDVIACHQAGVRNVVATLGTALTNQHVTELRRYCEKVVLIYDADEAGVKAADRAVEVFVTGGLDVAIAIIPDEMDPAELFAEPDGMAKWEQSIAQASDALEFSFKRMSGKLESQNTITGRQRLAEEFLQRMAGLDLEQWGPIRRALIVQRLATLLHMDEQTISNLLKKNVSQRTHRPAPVSGGTTGPSNDAPPFGESQPFVIPKIRSLKDRAMAQAGLQVIGCLLQQPSLFHLTLPDGRSLDESLTAADFVTEPEKVLYEKLYERLSINQNLTLAQWLGDLADDGHTELARLSTQADMEADRCASGEAEKLQQTLTLAAQAILRYHQDQEHVKLHRDVADRAQDLTDLTDQTAQLRRLMEHQRNPSVLRIKKTVPGS